MISDDDILSIVGGHLADSDHAPDYITPLNYYLGNPNGKEVEGRSSVTSTDVADAIEWIMPQIMKSFTQNNEIVIFDPLHEGDELQAELESEYVYEVMMKENNGFVILHQFVKDALMQKNGIIKVYYEDTPKTEVQEFTGLDPMAFQAALANPNIEPIAIEEAMDPATGQPYVNARVRITTPNGRVILESVAPESFRVNSDHNSINLDDAKFTAHIMTKTLSDLREQDIDEGIVKDIAQGRVDDSDYRFSAQGEYINGTDSIDESMIEVELAECYLKMDLNEDGIAEYVKVTVAGVDTPTHVLSVEELSFCPWVATTAIIMSHKFHGLSIYDRLKEIQDQKTALWRNMFDNLYLQNNQRHLVLEGQVNLDDLLLSRPGGIVRAKRVDAVTPMITPQIGPESAMMMQYLDSVRAGRVGVAPEGEAAPQNIGERVGSQGLDRLMTAKEELVGLMVRVVAETGIKPLCMKIRDLVTTHVDAIQDFQFRGQWVKVNPITWNARSKCTVRVGTGTGNQERKIQALREVMMLQEKMLMNPQQALVDQMQVYTTIDDFCKLNGLNGATRYFLDPRSEEGQQKKQQADQQAQEQQQQQMEMQMAMAKSQMQLAQAETQKAQAAQQTVQVKAEAEQAKAQLQFQKQSYESQIQHLRQQLEEMKAIADKVNKDADLEFKYEQMRNQTALELTRIESTHNKEQNSNFQGNKQDVA
jgi:hypothetical protein